MAVPAFRPRLLCSVTVRRRFVLVLTLAFAHALAHALTLAVVVVTRTDLSAFPACASVGAPAFAASAVTAPLSVPPGTTYTGLTAQSGSAAPRPAPLSNAADPGLAAHFPALA